MNISIFLIYRETEQAMGNTHSKNLYDILAEKISKMTGNEFYRIQTPDGIFYTIVCPTHANKMSFVVSLDVSFVTKATKVKIERSGKQTNMVLEERGHKLIMPIQSQVCSQQGTWWYCIINKSFEAFKGQIPWLLVDSKSKTKTIVSLNSLAKTDITKRFITLICSPSGEVYKTTIDSYLVFVVHSVAHIGMFSIINNEFQVKGHFDLVYDNVLMSNGKVYYLIHSAIKTNTSFDDSFYLLEADGKSEPIKLDVVDKVQFNVLDQYIKETEAFSSSNIADSSL
jgi:hypothetical protein